MIEKKHIKIINISKFNSIKTILQMTKLFYILYFSLILPRIACAVLPRIVCAVMLQISKNEIVLINKRIQEVQYFLH